jgi:hypothetical protein
MGSSTSSSFTHSEEDDVDLTAVAEAEKRGSDYPTATKTMRLIYFRAHPLVPKSALITRVCKQVNRCVGGCREGTC